MIKQPKTWKDLGPVKVDPTWNEYFLPFENDLERLTAMHIFRQQSVIGYLMSETFDAAMSNVNALSSVTVEKDYDKGIHFICAADNEFKVIHCFKALANELHNTKNLSTNRARQIMQAIKKSGSNSGTYGKNTDFFFHPNPVEMRHNMTSEPQIKRKEKFEIIFPEDALANWSTIAYLMLQRKYPKMGQVIENAFGIEFEKPNSTNAIDNPIRSISFWGSADSKQKVQCVLDVLKEDFEERRHYQRAAMQKITAEINEKGTYTRRSFNENAANENTPAKKHVIETTEKQKDLMKLIGENDLTFAIGPAGTGKTHIAMKMAVEALKSKRVKSILLARPATEAGEKIGFLPGDQNQKLEPYMRPLYDELDEAFGPGKYKKMLEEKTIEVVPVGFMRGRTFKDAFVVLDEAQNMTLMQIFTAATRVGYGTKLVITGDPAQVDLLRPEDSGLVPFMKVLEGKKSVAVQEFVESDCIRSEIVKTILDAVKESGILQPTNSLEKESAPKTVTYGGKLPLGKGGMV